MLSRGIEVNYHFILGAVDKLFSSRSAAFWPLKPLSSFTLDGHHTVVLKHDTEDLCRQQDQLLGHEAFNILIHSLTIMPCRS